MRHKRIRMLLIILGICFVVAGILLSVRVINRIEGHRPPLQRQSDVSLIQGWMTIPYVSRTYGVPVEIFEQEFKISVSDYRRSSIDELSKFLNKDSSVFLQEIQSLIVRFQQEHQIPPSEKL